MFHNLCDFIKDELKDLDKKVASGGKLSMPEIEYADKLSHIKKSLLTTEAMENPEDYYHDTRDYSARRDSRGRYAMYHDDMMAELRTLMDKAPNEQVRRKYRDFISEMEHME